MKRKFMLQVVAWLLTVAMLLPSAGAALTTAYAAGEKAAYTGSVTYAASGEWAEKEITMKDLIGNVNPDDVAYISFTSDAKFNVGYNPADHSAWKWANYSTKHDVSDIALDGWFAFKVALNANDGKNYTIKWSVYTGDAKTPAQEQEEQDKNANVVHSGSATFSDSTWWTRYEIKDRSALIGDVNPEDIAYVKFTCDTGFLLGYNNGGGYYQLESDSPVTTYVAKDINWDITAYYLQLILSKGDGKNYTIKWDVVSKVAATPTPTPTPTATPTPTPVPKYTDVGETLTVTKDMVKNGVVTIKNAQYNEIIVPAGLGITKINFNVIDVEKLVFEGGDSYTVNLRNALVEETEIAASKVEAMTYEELVKELEKAREAEDASDAVTAVANAFIASLQAKSKAAEAQIKLNAYDSVLDSVNVKANARIDVTEASVKDLAVSTKEASQRMEVRVTGFNGDAKVDLDKGGRTYNAPLSLTFRESAVGKLDVTGDEIFHVEGSKSTVDTMTLSGVNSVSSNLDAANLVVDEKNENANVRVYSDVANLIVEGEKNDVVLPASASIENAIVAGDNIRIYGLGTLGNAEVTGTGANVATIGTAVEGENNTTMPQAMIEMLPTATPTPIATPTPTIDLQGATYADSAEYLSDGWWAQYQLAKDALLGSVNAADVKYITFTCTSKCRIGYNPAGTADWITTDGAKNITILASDVEFFESFNIILTDNTGKNETVIWRIYTEGEAPKEPEVKPFTAVVTGENAWSSTSISKQLLLGDIAYEKVESITFTSEHTYQLGYNYSKTQKWTQHDDVKAPITIPISDITWDNSAYYLQVALWAASGNEYEISWTVNLKSEDNTHTHSYESKVTTAATCEKAGVKTFTCECGDTYTEAIEATGHSWDAEYTVDKAATCTEEGSKSIHCSACEATKNTTVIEKTEHNYKDGVCDCGDREESDVPVITPEGGNTGTSTGGALTPGTGSGDDGDNEEDACEHSYAFAVTKEATCTEKGVTTYTCGICGDSYTEEIAVDATAHNWNADYTVDEAATCTEAGSKSIHCSACDATKNSTVIEATGHSYENGVCGGCGEAEPLVETTVFLNTGYQGAWSSLGNTIPQSVFAQYTGDVKVTLVVEHVDATAGGQFACIVTDANYDWITVPTEEAADCRWVNAGESTVEFTLNKDSVDTIRANSALGFKVDNLIIKSAVVSGQGVANVDAGYAGDSAIAHKFHASELAAFQGKDIEVTITYRKTVASVEYYQAVLTNNYTWFSPIAATEDRGTMTLKLDKEKLDKVIADAAFLGIATQGLIIDSAYISEVEVLDTPVTVIFSSDVAGVEYETSDVSWLLNAADGDVLSVVYCSEKTDVPGWGVLGWGATVDGNWVNGPSYSADAEDSTTEVTATMTVAEFKTAFSITEASSVTYLKLGAFNGGKIISIGIQNGNN